MQLLSAFILFLKKFFYNYTKKNIDFIAFLAFVIFERQIYNINKLVFLKHYIAKVILPALTRLNVRKMMLYTAGHVCIK